MANLTPHTYYNLPPFKAWCQKVLPLVYDDSLSYYELLCKMLDYLNKMLVDLQNMGIDITTLYAAYNEFTNYVENYLKNLDVQEEINNKLDEMAESGELSAIIAPIVLNVAVPIFVDSIDKMTDTSRIYVLITTGYVYIWNGTAWYNTGMNYTDNFVNYMQVVGDLETGTDANDIVVNGYWNLSGGNTYLNLPVRIGQFQVISIKGVTYQLAINGLKSSPDYGKIYFRSQYGSPLVWGEWSSFDHHKNVPDVSTTSLPTNTDLNNVTTTSVWNLAGNLEYTNSPIIVGLLETFNAANVIYQIARSYIDGSIYFRARTGLDPVTWTEWHELNFTNTLQAKGLYDGTDLNDIIETSAWGLSKGVYDYANCPVSIGSLLTFNNDGVIYQRIIDGSPKYNGDMYFRVRYGTPPTWSEWSKTSRDRLTWSDIDAPEIGSIQYEENRVILKSFQSGCYTNQTGLLAPSYSYCRSKSLIKCKSRNGYRLTDTSILNSVYIVW